MPGIGCLRRSARWARFRTLYLSTLFLSSIPVSWSCVMRHASCPHARISSAVPRRQPLPHLPPLPDSSAFTGALSARERGGDRGPARRAEKRRSFPGLPPVPSPLLLPRLHAPCLLPRTLLLVFVVSSCLPQSPSPPSTLFAPALLRPRRGPWRLAGAEDAWQYALRNSAVPTSVLHLAIISPSLAFPTVSAHRRIDEYLFEGRGYRVPSRLAPLPLELVLRCFRFSRGSRAG